MNNEIYKNTIEAAKAAKVIVEAHDVNFSNFAKGKAIYFSNKANSVKSEAAKEKWMTISQAWSDAAE